MPLSPWWRRIRLVIVRSFSLAEYPLLTSRLRLGRSNELIKVSAFCRRNCSIMSDRVILSAVAVSAIMGTSGNSSCRLPNWLYSGLKSWPHCEIQCASSIAKRETFSMVFIHPNSVMSRSGEMYSSFISPRRHLSVICRLAISSFALFSASAAIPLATSVSTWSFISEMSGETTMAVPSIIKAGIWKQMDFPPPVGMSTSASLCCSTWLMISSCKGRKES